MRQWLAPFAFAAIALAACAGSDDAANTAGTPTGLAPPSTGAADDTTVPIRLSTPETPGSAAPQPTMIEAFTEVSCLQIAGLLDDSGALGRVQSALTDDTLTCGLNLVPDPTFATGRLPRAGEPISVILVLGPSIDGLPTVTIEDFVASGAGSTVSLVSGQPPITSPTSGDSHATLRIGDAKGVLARQGASLVTATWNDHDLGLVVAAADEARTIRLVTVVSGLDVTVEPR